MSARASRITTRVLPESGDFRDDLEVIQSVSGNISTDGGGFRGTFIYCPTLHSDGAVAYGTKRQAKLRTSNRER